MGKRFVIRKYDQIPTNTKRIRNRWMNRHTETEREKERERKSKKLYLCMLSEIPHEAIWHNRTTTEISIIYIRIIIIGHYFFIPQIANPLFWMLA